MLLKTRGGESAKETRAMLPLSIPPGTTTESLLESVLPDAHRTQVSARDAAEHLLGVHLDGGKKYLYRLTGPSVSFDAGDEGEAAHLHVAVARPTVERFLQDWMGEKRFLPSFAPADGVTLLTDPRVLKRLVMVTGTIELAMPDFEGSRVSLFVSASGGKKHPLKQAAPDTVVELAVPVFEKLLAGKLAPDDALTGGHVTVSGKKLVAMQFAFALAPFFPKV